MWVVARLMGTNTVRNGWNEEYETAADRCRDTRSHRSKRRKREKAPGLSQNSASFAGDAATGAVVFSVICSPNFFVSSGISGH